MRRLASFETMLASAVAGSALLLALMATGTGCTLGVADDDDDDDVTDNTDTTDGVEPPPPTDIPLPGKYVRGSLAPLFQLLPNDEQNRINPFGIAIQDNDFTVNGGGFLSVESMLDQVASQIAVERKLGSGAELNIISPADRIRAAEMPFRGKPSDVDVVRGNDGIDKLVIPLGGDISVPGNEVALVDPNVADGNGVVGKRIKVGIKPVKTAPHADGVAFVCNQYSNYISLVDVAEEKLVTRTDGTAVEIPTEYYCSDILVVDRVPNNGNAQAEDDEIYVYIANEWRGAVLRYDVTLVKDVVNDRVIDVDIDTPAEPVSTPAKYITGVGTNPIRLRLSDDAENIYVANGRGGWLYRVEVRTGEVLGGINIGAPAVDALQINASVFVPTTMPDRGYLRRDEVTPPDAQSAPIIVDGLTGNQEVAHPGAQFDRTFAYNFEDIRNGTTQVNLNLSQQEVYYTDNVSPEAAFVQEQKVLNGAEPVAAERNRLGNQIFLAHAGSDIVQILAVNNGANFRLTEIGGGVDTFETDARPWAMLVTENSDNPALDDTLTVANWGGETVQIFDLATQTQQKRFNVGYANLGSAGEYPATNIEIGEYAYYNANWSNNGRKSCATCHGPDNVIGDGLPFANGATAPTAPHEVKPNFNLLTTDDYFWNGSFRNGSYASLAFAAQTRTVCEQIAFAFIEGPSKLAAARVGDPETARRGFGAVDAGCAPQPFAVPDETGLPPNFDEIAAIIAQQKADAVGIIAGEVIALGGLADDLSSGTGGNGAPFSGAIVDNDVSRFVDYYSVAVLRLPPNPLKYLYNARELSSDEQRKIDEGKQLFTTAICISCHPEGNIRTPYADGLNHGRGADWNKRFEQQFQDDQGNVLDPNADPPIVLEFPQPFIDVASNDGSRPDPEINIHSPLDFFKPFCFDTQSCLVFEDPLGVPGNVVEQNRRLALIQRINFDDINRGFVPGNVDGSPRINTPSLRGAWWGASYLHHALARSIYEATLSPGHPGLRAGEKGFAVSTDGDFNSHGTTKDLSPAQVDALILYVESIE
jgi:mono/diheme cytochrome c family protein